MITMSSSRPYLLRAVYDWIVDNNCTPYLLVNALEQGVEVPQQHVKDGQIVLNISPSAVVGFSMSDTAVSFNARFGGVPTDIHVPISGIMGVYARENGKGMMFDVESPNPDPGPDEGSGAGKAKAKSKSSKPQLKIVK